MEDDQFEKRYKKHQSKFVLGRKTAQELVDSLNEILDMKLVPLTTISEWLFGRLKFNISHHEDALRFQPEQLEYHLYSVIPNQKSKTYYDDKNFVDWADGKMLMLLETKTGLFESNAASFGSAACILRGVDESNIAQRNMTFWEYLAFFELEEEARAYH